ncbi:DUF1045 domain-containing protein [Allorhizobium pseudoryzae]|uniref:DUF1045 domain-containing protein n=1 Tax=Allorhizobium pseudoryzae TaxID=379684 RepID=UPI003CFC080E
MRYALYFTPPATDPLTKAAAAWLGRDPFTETHGPAPEGLDEETWQSLTAEPRRYGFHATLKAPFHLAAGTTETELVEAFRSFCASTAPVAIPSLALRALGPFFALVPRDDSADIDSLCTAIVETFEPFRAPLSPEDVARRRPERLTERQRELLTRFGYPYVHEQFRFHMTLTGPVVDQQHAGVSALLSERFGPFLDRPLDIAHLALFAERERGAPFHVLVHNSLEGREAILAR